MRDFDDNAIHGLKECVDMARTSNHIRLNHETSKLSDEQLGIILFLTYQRQPCSMYSMRLGVDNKCTLADINYLVDAGYIEWEVNDILPSSSIVPKVQIASKGLNLFRSIFF